MIDFLKLMGPEGLLFIFIASLIAIVQLFRFIVKKRTTSIPTQHNDPLIKKYDDVNLDKYTQFFRLLGLCIGMTTLLAAFEYPTPNDVLVTLQSTSIIDNSEYDSVYVLPKPKVPQIKKPPVVTIIEVKDDVKIDENIEIDIPEGFDPNEIIEEYVPDDEPSDDEPVKDFVVIAEKSAAFKGGMGKFYKWIGRRMKYPSQAKRMGVEGKVFVEFIVERNGKLTDIKVVRGIGAGCDEEAIRVLEACPNWNPGEQRGRPVRQKMVIPISFRLH